MMEEHIQETTTVEQPSHVDGGEQSGAENTQVAAENVGEMPEANRQEYNWRQANESLSTMKAENAAMRQQVQMLTNFANQSQQINQQQQQPQQTGYFHGREKEDLSSVGDVEAYVDNALGAKTKEFQQTIQQLQLQNDQMQLQAKDPEFKQKIETYQQYLTDAQKQAIVNSSKPWSDAYDAVVNSAAYYRDQISQQQSPSAKRISDNSQKPGSLSSVGSSASLSRSSSWENYTDADLIRMGDNYANGGG
ncbi:hypothetical protein OAF54_02135, partial [bacterium]|nr:hypothetical protein [bacterium]